MVTLNNLHSQSSKDLARFARNEGVPGWHNMRKEQLIQALTRLLKRRNQSKLAPKKTVPRLVARNGQKAQLEKTALDKSALEKGSLTKVAVAKSTVLKPADSRSLMAKVSAAKPAAAKPALEKPAMAKSQPVKTSPEKASLEKTSLEKASLEKSLRDRSAIVKPKPPVAALSKPVSQIAAKLQAESKERERLKNLALTASLNKDHKQVTKDRVVLIVRDSYWLQAYWEVTEQTVRRAKTALEKHWRGAIPVLRLYEFSDDDNVPEQLVKQVEVHGGVDTWFIDTLNPPKTYRVAIGYAAPNGRFYMIGKSNKVTTPVPSGHPGNGNWADIAQDCENYFALSGGYLPDNDVRELQDVFEEKLRRPMAPIGPGNAMIIDPRSEFQFEVDAQMVVYGVAAPGSSVTLAGEPLKIDPDGTFSIRMDLPDKRQVLPVVACSRDGAHQRTTVLSIERNTKVMEPVNMDVDEP